MYYDVCIHRRGEKVYRRELIRESFRRNGKVCKRTLANVTHWPEPVKAVLRAVLGAGKKGARNPDRLTELVRQVPGVQLTLGGSVGALAALKAVADRLGITQALGTGRQGRLALLQVLMRVMEQGSRLSAVRAASGCLVKEVVGVDSFNEDDLYENLDWLCENQAKIEDRLFRRRSESSERPSLFLYDVTSTYLEGECNELAAFGYNRDGKKGKKQVVVGLLTDEEGRPLSIEVFRGNTADPSTVYSQVRKISERFGGGEVTFVGDRGMLKSRPISAVTEAGMHYITAITKSQIRKLVRTGVIQPELFDQDIAEVWSESEQVRYVVRRNEGQAVRARRRREDQLRSLEALVSDRNEYLMEHPHAQVDAAVRRVRERIRRYNLSAWVGVLAEGRRIRLEIDESLRARVEEFDGCYALKTDLRPDQLSKEQVDLRYRDLAQVDQAFRTSKTVHLEMRPVYVRLASRTRGHALVVMLAYMIVRELRTLWGDLDVTVEEGVRRLSRVCALTARSADGTELFHGLPRLCGLDRRLLEAVGLNLDAPLPVVNSRSVVDTRKKLHDRRKS